MHPWFVVRSHEVQIVFTLTVIFRHQKKMISNETAINASLNQPSNLTPGACQLYRFPGHATRRKKGVCGFELENAWHFCYSNKSSSIDLTVRSAFSKAGASQTSLVGGWTNPFQKYARQNGSFPEIGVNIKKYLKPPTRWSSKEACKED